MKHTPHKREQLITPKEAFIIAREENTIDDFYNCKSLLEYYIKNDTTANASFPFRLLVAAAYIYRAGIVQGIREERKKRKTK